MIRPDQAGSRVLVAPGQHGNFAEDHEKEYADVALV